MTVCQSPIIAIASLFLFACSGSSSPSSSQGERAGASGVAGSGGGNASRIGSGVGGAQAAGGTVAMGEGGATGVSLGGERAVGGSASQGGSSAPQSTITSAGRVGTPAVPQAGAVTTTIANAQAGALATGGTRSQAAAGMAGKWVVGGSSNHAGSSAAGAPGGGMVARAGAAGVINAPTGIGGKPGTGGAAGAANSPPITCESPACCFPLTIRASNIRIYKSDTEIVVSPVIEMPNNNESSDQLDITLEVTTPWGTSVTCTASIAANTSKKYVALTCPALPAAPSASCGATSSFKLKLGTSIPGEAGCGASFNRQELQFSLPITCDWTPCPSGPAPGNACDAPPTKICGHRGYTGPDNKTVVQTNCICDVDPNTGARALACTTSSA